MLCSTGADPVIEVGGPEEYPAVLMKYPEVVYTVAAIDAAAAAARRAIDSR